MIDLSLRRGEAAAKRPRDIEKLITVIEKHMHRRNDFNYLRTVRGLMNGRFRITGGTRDRIKFLKSHKGIRGHHG